MRSAKLAALTLSILSCAIARGGAPADARPKGATVVGTVCARLGSYVVVALAEGATVQPGDQLLVGHPTLLVTVAKGKTRTEAWGNWQETGRIKVRTLRGTRCCIAVVTREKARTALDGKPAPNIRPSEIAYRPPRAPSPKPETP